MFKRVLSGAGMFALCSSILYLIGAFISGSFDCTVWDYTLKCWLSLISVVGSLWLLCDRGDCTDEAEWLG